MKSIYAFVKISVLIAVTVGYYCILITVSAVLRIFNRDVDTWRNRCLTAWGRTAARTLSISVHVKGTIPSPPFFLVCNHLSYVDIIVLFSRLNTTFVSKSEIAKWPLIGPIARSIGIVFINRRKRSDIKRVNHEISEAVTERRGLTLFPEGTTSPGREILPFRPSLLEFPANSDLGVNYCTIRYSTGPPEKDNAFKTVCWWEDVPIGTHLWNLALQNKIEATLTFGDHKIVDNNRKVLTEKLHIKVTELFIPMCHGQDVEYEPIQF